MKLRQVLLGVSILVLMIAGIAKAEDGAAKTEASLGGAEIGGHVKLFLYDGTEGERNGVKQQNVNSMGFAYHSLQMYITKEVESWLKLDAQVEWNAAASATPSLGKDITRAKTVTVSPNIFQLVLTLQLPYDIEMKAGNLLPPFSEYYSREVFWHERFHLDALLCRLISTHDFGVEFYKNFDIGAISLPVTVDILNGSYLNPVASSIFVDNNNNKMLLFHVAPELLRGSLRLLGSYGMGKWDDAEQYDMSEYEYGAEYTYSQIRVFAEYISRNYNSYTLVGQDSARKGYHVDVTYTFNDTWRAGASNSRVDLPNAGTTVTDGYDTNTLLLNYSMTPNSTIIAQYSLVDSKKSDDSDKLKYNRFTLGWRLTF